MYLDLLTRLQSLSRPSSTSSFSLSTLSSWSHSSVLCTSQLSSCSFFLSACIKTKKFNNKVRLAYRSRTCSIRSLLHPHLCCVFVSFSFQGPVGALPPEDQVLLGQLQGELGHLQAGLVQLGVGIALTGAQLPQLPTQALRYMLTSLQALLQPSHLHQSSLILHLQRDELSQSWTNIATRRNREVKTSQILLLNNSIKVFLLPLLTR